MTKPKRVVLKTKQFELTTSKGVVATYRFCSFSDDPEIGREKAHAAAVRAQEAWLRNPSYLPADEQQLALVER